MSGQLTHVHLIYQPMSDDKNKWQEVCASMPVKARVSWAVRCAKDVDHLAKDIPEAGACIEAIEKWLRDEISDEELSTAGGAAYAVYAARPDAGCTAANSALYAARAASDAHAAALAANDAAIYAGGSHDNYVDRWNLYKEWYWEELAKWHSSQNVTVLD